MIRWEISLKDKVVICVGGKTGHMWRIKWLKTVEDDVGCLFRIKCL